MAQAATATIRRAGFEADELTPKTLAKRAAQRRQMLLLIGASYGIDALRRTVLTASGVPSRVLDSLGLTIFGHPLSVWPEEAVLVAFGLLMMSLAVYGFRQRD